MKTSNVKETTKTNPEKERLELIEKKVEIKKKRVEIQKEILNMDETSMRKKIALDEQSLTLNKIWELGHLLGAVTVDEDRTIVGSEPFLIRTMSEDSRQIIESKIMRLIQNI